MGFFKKLVKGNPFKAIGGLINDITGQSAAAKQQFDQQMTLQKNAQDYSTWQMSNAHQLEKEDLEKAGVNSILTGGGGGASAGVSMGGSTGGTSAGDPISMIGNIINAMNTTARTQAEINKLKVDSINETNLTDAQVNNLDAGTNKTTTTTTKDKKIAEIYDIPILGSVLGFLNEAFGGGSSAAIAGAQVSQAHTSAKKTKTTKKNKIGF